MKNENLQQLLKEGKINAKTLERVNIAKSYIEKKYSIKKMKEEEKKKDWEFFNKKMEELNLSNKEKELIKKDVLHKEAEYLRLQRKKISIREFESIAIIGRGAFGEVRVCRHIESGDIVAIKKMRKEEMLSKNQIMHVRTEREILTTANIPWIVNLRYSFQDDSYLYLVMDYLPGGDFMSLLMKKDILTEEEARFYIAELILAVESVHGLNCIHRDLKPDNILIDKKGHIQLSDFGLSKLGDQSFYPMSIDAKPSEDVITIHKPGTTTITDNKLSRQDIKTKRKNRLVAYSTVGTPDYIAPEVFGQQGYGMEVDWWSVGVILFESLVGYPPFFSEKPAETCEKIVRWKQYFQIPHDANLSLEAENLIRRLVTVPEQRLGINGAEEIKKHPFFKGMDWNNIRVTKAPFIPDILNDWDTKYFDTFPEQEPFYPPEKRQKKRKDINYAGYTYNRDMENQKGGLLHALEVLEAVKQSTKNIDEKYKIVDEIEKKESKTNSKDLTNSNTTTGVEKEVHKPHLETKKVEQAKVSNNVIILNNKETSKQSTSPENIKSTTTTRLGTGTKTTTNGKGLNIIPIKNLVLQKEQGSTMTNGFSNNHNERLASDRFSPKPRDLKITSTNLSPKQKLIPTSSKNVNANMGFDTTKYTNKIYANISSGMHKSPSPRPFDRNNLLKKSPEMKK